MKKLIIIGSLLLIVFPIVGANGQNQIPDGTVFRDPVIEIIDLNIDGTGGVFVNVSQDFDYIMRLVYNLDFIDNSLDFDVFAGEAAPLTNGLLMFYNDIPFLNGSGLKSNDDFGNIGYDLSVLSDEKNPKGRTILGRLSFFKFIVGGLLINDQRTLAFKVQDNMSALTSIDEFSVAVEGYKMSQGSFSFEGQDSINYGVGHKTTLRIEGLGIGKEYTLMIANNTLSAYNITWTANRNIAEIDLDYSGIKIDNNNVTLQELQIILVENGDTIKFTYYLRIKYFGLSEFINWIAIIAGTIIVLFLSMILLLAIIERLK
ncbi:hypothetical protein LCGC14_1068320 [marine sediment metagenome]|uniref:Uncharacterized protein n=1 Tax=marine sediment metagenome TaxID=412755 RepID=A0A0F9MJ25_9ZZZZ|nr:hypothetical protein [archaeon]